MRTGFVVLVGVMACGGGGAGGDAPGGDSMRTDAALDAPGIDAAVVGCARQCVVSAQAVPTTGSAARALALDLDGDGQADDQLGQALAALAGEGLDFLTPATAAIDRGLAITLVDFAPDGSGGATFAMFAGADPVPAACAGSADTTCRHDLGGTATFTALAGSGANPALAGALDAGTYAAGPGHLTLQTGQLGTPLGLDLVGARVQATTDGDQLASVLVGGGITTQEMVAKVYPGLAAYDESVIAAQCTDLATPPGCGCPSGSQGKTLVALFDIAPQDCHISTAEVQNNSLVKSLFAPDLTLEGQSVLSVGTSVSLVGAVFTPPAQ